jgi:hypothetical protein
VGLRAIEEGDLREIDQELMAIQLPYVFDVAIADVPAVDWNIAVVAARPLCSGDRVGMPVDVVTEPERLAEECNLVPRHVGGQRARPFQLVAVLGMKQLPHAVRIVFPREKSRGPSASSESALPISPGSKIPHEMFAKMAWTRKATRWQRPPLDRGVRPIAGAMHNLARRHGLQLGESGRDHCPTATASPR